MKLTPKIEKAINVSAFSHREQFRRDGGLPYIVHPFSVAVILSEYTEDEDVIAAGLLHDVIEDCGYSAAQLTKEFGRRVSGFVVEVSEDVALKDKLGEKGSWEERKEKYLEHMKEATPEAMLVCAADKIHNLRSLVSAYKSEGAEILEKFNSSSDRKLWFYGEVLRILSKRLDSPIVADLEKAFSQAKKLISK